jgi:hypothetical protein
MEEIQAEAVEKHVFGTSASSLQLQCERPALRIR